MPGNILIVDDEDKNTEPVIQDHQTGRVYG